MVRKGGFEPPCLTAPPPQDGVSASSTTSANKRFIFNILQAIKRLELKPRLFALGNINSSTIFELSKLPHFRRFLNALCIVVPTQSSQVLDDCGWKWISRRGWRRGVSLADEF